jgi:hypothetical protein
MTRSAPRVDAVSGLMFPLWEIPLSEISRLGSGQIQRTPPPASPLKALTRRAATLGSSSTIKRRFSTWDRFCIAIESG